MNPGFPQSGASARTQKTDVEIPPKGCSSNLNGGSFKFFKLVLRSILSRLDLADIARADLSGSPAARHRDLAHIRFV